MSALALLQVTQALRKHLAPAAGGEDQVHVGAPIPSEVGGRRLAIFPFHLLVNQSLRNHEYTRSPGSGIPSGPVPVVDALPLDLRILITVFRATTVGAAAAEPTELSTLGRIVQRLHAEPTLPPAETGGKPVRLTPEPYPMEELSRVFGLLPSTPYRTSMVYLASPVVVEVEEPPLPAPPVEERILEFGVLESGEQES